jgi:hypothetical protein
MLTAVLTTFHHQVPVSLPAENINPAHNGKGKKMSGRLIPDFVAIGKFITHNKNL